MTRNALPTAAAPAKVAPIKTTYPGSCCECGATDAPELRTADHFSVAYIAHWGAVALLLLLASMGLGVVAGYLYSTFGG